MPSWPEINYRPLRAGWNIEPLLPPISTEMEGGNVRQRRRPGDNVAVVTQTIVVTSAEFATLESFVKTTLNGGSARFTMLVYFLGTGYVSKTVQFMSSGQTFPYSPRPVGRDRVAVSMTLRVYGA